MDIFNQKIKTHIEKVQQFYVKHICTISNVLLLYKIVFFFLALQIHRLQPN